MSGFSDINWLYHKYYGDNPQLRRIVTLHSEQVAKKALQICEVKNLKLNPRDVYIAAMIHDIGVVKCNAPEIHAKGSKNYLLHGVEGELILLSHHLEKFASICSTHTGAGITKEEIIEKNLPLPQRNFLPKTLLEKLICYSDKFFSKSHDLTKEKDLNIVMAQIRRHGEGPEKRFLELHNLFS